MTLINSLPAVPSRSSGFSAAQAETFLEALPDFVTETNAALAYFNLRNADASAVTMWVPGNYTKGAVVWSPATGTNYRAKATHTSATDPSLDGTNWEPATGISGTDQAKLDLITITEAKNLDAVVARPVRTADGAISKGDVLVRQSDGTVAAVTSSVGGAATGSDAVFNAGSTFVRFDAIAADPSTGKFLIVYSDDADGDKGKAVVATVTGTSVSYGTPVAFEAGAMTQPVVHFDPDNSKFLICYKLSGGTFNIKAVVCTVSGTTPSFGSSVDSGVNGVELQLTYDTANNKFALGYYDSGGTDGTAVVVSVSGTTPSFGTAADFDTNFGTNLAAGFDPTTGKTVHVYGRSAAIYGYLGTVSGTSISFGSAQTIHAVDGYQESGEMAYAGSGGKFLLVYENGSDSSHGYAVVITVSGSTISAGTPVKFNAATTYVYSVMYFPDDDEFYVVFSDGGNSSYLTSMTVTVSGTVPSFSSFTVLRSHNPAQFCGAFFDETSGVALITYRDSSTHGAAFAHVPSSVTTNADKWFTVAASDAADEADVQIYKVGDIVDELSGLTYDGDVYVDVDGSLTHSVTAYGKIGFALSATELLITETN